MAISNRASLKRKLLFDYDKTSIPDEKVTFGIEIHPMNLDLCPKTQVIFHSNQFAKRYFSGGNIN